MHVSFLKRLGRWARFRQQDPIRQEGNKKPGEGPPDLDQLWRDFNGRLAKLFGGSGDSSGPGPVRGEMRGVGPTVGLVVAIIVLIWLASGSFIVQEGQAGVVTTFGKYTRTTGPGFNWRWPWPMQASQVVNVSQVRNEEIGYKGRVGNKVPHESLMLTDDENIIDIQFNVQYTLKDPVAWLFNNREPEQNVRQVAESAIREVVGRSRMDFVLYEGREKVARDVHALMQQMLDRYGSGAQINNVSLQAVQPPEQVQGAFDDAVKAGQDRERAKNEGQAYANRVIPEARGKAIRLIQEAEAYRAMVTENATGNAARFNQVVTEYAKAPAVTRDRMYLDTMQQIFANTNKVMVDAKSNSNLLYLPLDKLVAQNAANDAAHAAAQAQAQAQPAPADQMQQVEIHQQNPRSRDNQRERETR